MEHASVFPYTARLEKKFLRYPVAIVHLQIRNNRIHFIDAQCASLVNFFYNLCYEIVRSTLFLRPDDPSELSLAR